MTKKIAAALISVFYKDGLEPVVQQLHKQGVTIYSTGGTQDFIEKLGIPVIPVEQLTSYPSILGGRVKTLHPLLFGGILGRRNVAADLAEMREYGIPEIDLVIVDLYPFIETVNQTDDEAQIIEKIDIGGPSMIRGAAKNFSDVTVIASKDDYPLLVTMLEQNGGTTQTQRKSLAAKAFQVVAEYDNAIADYFNENTGALKDGPATILRYGENPHQHARFEGDLSAHFTQLHGKELSFNNLVDVDAALELMRDFTALLSVNRPNNGAAQDGPEEKDALTEAYFAIIKHTNVCGIAARPTAADAWEAALAGDPESAFGGVLISSHEIDGNTATAINELFFEVLIAPKFAPAALTTLQSKKNRILLQVKDGPVTGDTSKSLLNGTLTQQKNFGNFNKWEETGGRHTTAAEKADLTFANLVCKHLKSNAIALVKNRQLVGKGCGQTSRVDALRHALEKAAQFSFDLRGAVMASDAFFPFRDCVELGKEAGITAFIQPGGSIRDKDSVEYCKTHNLAMVLTGQRHFRH